MALVSPGVEVTIIDESQYTSSALNTVPYILLATAKNKLTPAGDSIAPGTLASAADNVYLITSQRDLVNTFGNPVFYKTAAGDAIHGHELNEYGLMAAYSVLGVTNRVYIQRADIDLAELESSLVRPLGSPADGTYWLDLADTAWGIFEWASATNTFNAATPMLITDVTNLVGGVATGAPLASLGTIGQYAVNTTLSTNPIYRKMSDNTWQEVGAAGWKSKIATITGTIANPTITATQTFSINGTLVTSSGTTVTSLASDINLLAITGITAAAVNGRLEIYTDGTSTNDGGTTLNVITITVGTGTILTDIGVTAATYWGPVLDFDTHVNVPRWRSTDTTPRPSGSVWVKTTAVNGGADIIVKEYDALTSSWVTKSVPLYANDQTANKWLDPAAGGLNIAAGSLYAMYDFNESYYLHTNNNTTIGTIQVFNRAAAGATTVTGATLIPVFTLSSTFTISVSQANSTVMTTPATITLTGTDAATFVSDVLAAGVANITAAVTSTGAVSITHTGGGVIQLVDGTNTPLATAGITTALANVRLNSASALVVSNWETLTPYTASVTAPSTDPVAGTNWYYSDFTAVDIMIHDGGIWKGYNNVTNDVRGVSLAAAKITVAATAPTAPTAGDLWIDSTDLENFPVIYRRETIVTGDVWTLIDNADQTTSNGILFADARWAPDGKTDPISGTMPTLASLLISDYVDPDAPSPALYPDGMLLWNTRRSGFNVKQFKVNYFNSTDFDLTNYPTPSVLTVTNAWVTVSGHNIDGSAFMGRHAQRNMIVEALKAAIDTNTDIREEQRAFNLLAAPGYPELMTNMVSLNNERKNTGFIIGDTPLRLANNGTDITNWATNNGGLGLPAADGLNVSNEYLAVFYPSGQTTDLSGTTIVVPPSYMMLRTIIHSDELSYQWIAPAGVRRGIVDNASAIGYVDATTGEFKTMATRQGIRDVLYTNNINPIMFEAGVGYMNYGNKTTKPGSAEDRINVARLTCYIRVLADQIGRQYVFEPNDKTTRDEIKGQMERMLNDLVAKRGVYNFLVVCDDSNNTPTRIDANELWVDIAIEPVKDAEFVYVPVRLKNTGSI